MPRGRPKKTESPQRRSYREEQRDVVIKVLARSKVKIDEETADAVIEALNTLRHKIVTEAPLRLD